MPLPALLTLAVLYAATLPAWGDESRSDVSIQVTPDAVMLDGVPSAQRLVVSLHSASGRAKDVTCEANYRSLDGSCCTVDSHGRVTSGSAGQTVIEVTAGDATVRVPVIVRNASDSSNPSFATDVVPILSRFGCNSSACHGKAEGQNGFKLSVFGFDQQADYDALVREGRGRRVFPAAPDRSLVLGKASGMVPHGGGARLSLDSNEYRVVRDWIAAGARLKTESPDIVSIEVYPAERILEFESKQQILVTAVFDDGSRRDVTDLARYRSNNEGMAIVDQHGLVQVGRATGHVAVMAEFLNRMQTFQILVPNSGVEGQALADSESSDNAIDRMVERRLQQLNIVAASGADDATFMRRVFMDVIGTLPTSAEARRFLNDLSESKRVTLVNELLDRPEYATYWALKWSDILRVDRAVLGHRRAYAWYRWIRKNIEGEPASRRICLCHYNRQRSPG